MPDLIRAAVRVTAVTVTVLLLASCGGDSDDTPAAAQFGQIIVFGGTGSDTGNACASDARSCPPSPPNANGRYSNGPLWIETVAAHYGAIATPSRLGGYNYAFAGSTTGLIPGSKQMTPTPAERPTMVAQVDQYLARAGAQANPQDLIILDGSAVGLNIQQALIPYYTNGPAAVIAQAVSDMGAMIARLYVAGARTVVVVNGTNIGLTPWVGSNSSPTARADATQMSTNFNAGLAQQMAIIRAGSPGLQLFLVDVFALEAAIMAAPAPHGFTNVTAPCYVETTPSIVCSTPDTYYFWNSSFPTAAAGRLLAQETIRVIGR